MTMTMNNFNLVYYMAVKIRNLYTEIGTLVKIDIEQMFLDENIMGLTS